MGNVSSRHKYYSLKTNELKETGFQNFMEVSLAQYGAKIEYVSDESFGNSSKLLMQEAVDKDLIFEDDEINTHGWLTKRHEKEAIVTVALCNDTNIVGFDIETTGYSTCCPSFAKIEGCSQEDSQWHQLVPQVPIRANSHNFFELKSSYSFSSVRLSVYPGGGIARFRTYGDVTPRWTKEISNLASATLGAQVVRWTDQKSANSKNVLLDNGTKMSDGWLTPRSKLGQDRNDYIIIKLATVANLCQIVIDTRGFEHNSPNKITIQGCYSDDIDPYYAPTKWIPLVSHEDVNPGDYTLFDIETPTKLISHLKVYLVPDGGIQQIIAYGVPAVQKKRSIFMIEPSKPIENNKKDTAATFEVNVVIKEEEETVKTTSLSNKRKQPSDEPLAESSNKKNGNPPNGRNFVE